MHTWSLSASGAVKPRAKALAAASAPSLVCRDTIYRHYYAHFDANIVLIIIYIIVYDNVYNKHKYRLCLVSYIINLYQHIFM